MVGANEPMPKPIAIFRPYPFPLLFMEIYVANSVLPAGCPANMNIVITNADKIRGYWLKVPIRSKAGVMNNQRTISIRVSEYFSAARPPSH